MAPQLFTEEQFGYVRKRLYILSGFYGILRPFDGVLPYRLEMQAKIKFKGYKSLYEFWGAEPAKKLISGEEILEMCIRDRCRPPCGIKKPGVSAGKTR